MINDSYSCFYANTYFQARPYSPTVGFLLSERLFPKKSRCWCPQINVLLVVFQEMAPERLSYGNPRLLPCFPTSERRKLHAGRKNVSPNGEDVLRRVKKPKFIGAKSNERLRERIGAIVLENLNSHLCICGIIYISSNLRAMGHVGRGYASRLLRIRDKFACIMREQPPIIMLFSLCLCEIDSTEN